MKEWKLIRGLLDCRTVQKSDKITFQGLQQACEIQIEEYAGRDYRYAILINAGKHKMVAEIFAHTLRLGNLNVNVFVDDIDEAFRWLGYDQITVNYLKGKIKKYVQNVDRELPHQTGTGLMDVTKCMHKEA
ncbi:hypothetical protein [Desulfosarcina widdelii]|nr:hypothetical protein [Desulfosarcina widdelii]